MNLDRVQRYARKFLATSLVTVVSTAGILAVAPSTASAAPAATVLVSSQAASPAFSASYYEHGVQYWVNHVRRAHHLKPLRLATCTDAVAERWSAYLASTNGFYHQSMTKLLYQCNAYYAGETLGRGSIKPRTLVNMWMHSAPHRKVLMSHSPTRIGIGATPNARGEWVVAANFMKF
jgi:uncharacterized protein YkwD